MVRSMTLIRGSIEAITSRETLGYLSLYPKSVRKVTGRVCP